MTKHQTVSAKRLTSKDEAPSTATKALRLFFLLVFTNVVGYVGSGFVTSEALGWYHALPLAPLTPPDAVFGFVWTGLYFLMAFSAFAVWGKASPRWFVMQLAMSLIWPFTFFYLREIGIALGIAVLMAFFLILAIRDFYRVNRVAGLLLIPALGWSLFAVYLNLFILMP